MTNEELMQLMTEMGRHEGGMENWIPDNAWLLVANRAIEIEREACAKIAESGTGEAVQSKTLEILRKERERIATAIRARGNNDQ